MLSMNRKLSHKGFSLIELMVAVVILVMAIFGIFLAFSTSFQGMADARDRTVAVNYLREAIEDFKNMDFEQVKSKAITPIPNTKFSRGTYVLNLEETEIDKVVTLKKVIVQVRWIDRKGNIKTEKTSTIIYNKPATSEVGDTATKLVLYAQSYYTILPTHDVDLVAEIKDENGNIYDWDGEIIFSIVTVRDEYGMPLQVGDIATEPPIYANDGVANCTFTAFTGEDIEGIERIQAAANIDGEDLTDTVNIRVTTGPAGIVILPLSKEDEVLAAGTGVSSNIMLYVVKADYDYNNPVAYESPITLSADGPGTLSETTIGSVETVGYEFYITSNGTPGVVEITASAPDLDIGYTEITFTGEPDSILIEAEKNSIYPGEEIDITVTIVDENKVPLEFSKTITLEALIDGELTTYGILGGLSNSISLGPVDEDFSESTFKATLDSPVGETITIQASAEGGLSDSTEITILSSLTPKYLKLFPISQIVDLNGTDEPPTITATVTDVSGTTVTTYSTSIIFEAKNKYGVLFGGFPSSNPETQDPIEGEVNIAFDTSGISGTATITASSGDLLLRPEEGVEVVFYNSPDHIVLSAEPESIEADGQETSIITATVCDIGGNRVANYGENGEYITFNTSIPGKFYDLLASPALPESDLNVITIYDFDEGVAIVGFYTNDTEAESATIIVESSEEEIADGSVTIALTGDILSVLTLGEVTNQTDYLISFDITVTGSPIYLEEIKVEWNNSSAPLDDIIIDSPYPEEYPLKIPTYGADSPCTESGIVKTLVTTGVSNIGLNFRDGVSKMKQKDIIVTFTDDDTSYVVSFRVPNM